MNLYSELCSWSPVIAEIPRGLVNGVLELHGHVRWAPGPPLRKLIEHLVWQAQNEVEPELVHEGAFGCGYRIRLVFHPCLRGAYQALTRGLLQPSGLRVRDQ